MCAVGCLVGRGARLRMFDGSPHFLSVFYIPDRREHVPSRVLNLQTNFVKFNVFINAHVFSVTKTKSSLYGPYTKYINIYVYI